MAIDFVVIKNKIYIVEIDKYVYSIILKLKYRITSELQINGVINEK